MNLFTILNIFIFINSLKNSFINSLKIRPKFCINCKHFRLEEGKDPIFAKCEMFPNENTDYLVSGELSKEYKYCTTVRAYDDLCGTNATKYVKKYKKKGEKKSEKKDDSNSWKNILHF
jgi:hypothetical protein